MSDKLLSCSDDALVAEVARRLALRTSARLVSDGASTTPMTPSTGGGAVEIPTDLADTQHDSEAIRRLLEANSRRGLRRCEVGEAFRMAGREALNIDQKIQYLIGRNELAGESGPDGRRYWRLVVTGKRS